MCSRETPNNVSSSSQILWLSTISSFKTIVHWSLGNPHLPIHFAQEDAVINGIKESFKKYLYESCISENKIASTDIILSTYI